MNHKIAEGFSLKALLRMDKHLTYAERMQRVEEVLDELGLTKCADTLIGEPERAIKGISGGEKRRLAFATEVILVSSHGSELYLIFVL